MTAKIKEFRGILEPIFSEDIQKDIKDEYTTTKEFDQGNCIPMEKIRPRKDQPRKIFDENALDELAISIKAQGVIQPIVVSPLGDGDTYEIIVGERRWRAAEKAGLREIPAIIRSYNKLDVMAIALIENIQRENLNPLEEANAIQKLLLEFSMTHSQIAETIGRSRVTITHLLRLLNLESEVKDLINLGLIEMGHAKALMCLEGQQQINAAKHIVDKSLSVRATEKFVKNFSVAQEKKDFFLPEELSYKIEAWKNSFAKSLFTKVNMHIDAAGKGRLVIQFDSVEEAEWLMNNLEIKKS